VVEFVVEIGDGLSVSGLVRFEIDVGRSDLCGEDLSLLPLVLLLLLLCSGSGSASSLLTAACTLLLLSDDSDSIVGGATSAAAVVDGDGEARMGSFRSRTGEDETELEGELEACEGEEGEVDKKAELKAEVENWEDAVEGEKLWAIKGCGNSIGLPVPLAAIRFEGGGSTGNNTGALGGE